MPQIADPSRHSVFVHARNATGTATSRWWARRLTVLALRSDASFSSQEAQIGEVEALVNGWIQEAHPVETRTMALAEAKAAGAVAMFGEKYSDTARSLR